MTKKYRNWLKEIASEIRESQIWQYSTFVTFYFLVTIPPIFLAVVNGLRGAEVSLEPVFHFINRFLPDMLSDRLIIDLEIIYTRSSVGIYALALIASIWSISLLTTSIVVSINKSYGVDHRKNIIVLRVFAFVITFIIVGFFVGVSYISWSLNLGTMVDWVIFILTVFLTLCFFYYTVPNAKQPFIHVLPGAILGTLVVMVAIGVYFVFLYFLPTGSIFYTLLGSLIIVLQLIHKVWVSVLAGAVLNRYLTERRFGQIIEKNEDSKFIRLLVKMNFIDDAEKQF